MGGATGFIWMAVVILALGWALQLTGTVNLGMNLNLWLPVLLVLAVLGAVFNMFVVPFLGRTRTSTSTVNATGTGVAAGPAVLAAVPGTVSPVATPVSGVAQMRSVPAPPVGVWPGATPVSGVAQQEVVQQTRDHTSL
jgi:hypothetical protein